MLLRQNRTYFGYVKIFVRSLLKTRNLALPYTLRRGILTYGIFDRTIFSIDDYIFLYKL